MKRATNPHKLILPFVILLSLILSTSCAKDTDLFLEAVLEEEVIDEESTIDESSNNDENTGNETPPPPPEPDFENTNRIEGTYTPTSAAEISDPARANFKAIISKDFDCGNCTFAPNQTIEPAGGSISGAGINLNGAYIENTEKQAFAPEARFNQTYSNSRLSPETFGANGNDSFADDIHISSLINNSSYAIGKENAVYIKNRESTYTRFGIFNWNMNNSIIKTTNDSNLSHGSGTENLDKYLFEFRELNPSLFNGEFDGNNIASRLIKVQKGQNFSFIDLNIHDYFAPPNAYARSVALRLEINADSNYNFTMGEVRNCSISNIGAASDGNANNSPFGVSKAIWTSESSDGSEANLYFTNNKIRNIDGDDAEGFYSDKLWLGNYDYQLSKVNYIFDNEDYRGCQRRAMKITVSNASITNSYFESASNSPIFPGAQATLLHFFSTSGSDKSLDNINFTGNEIVIKGNAENPPIGMNDISGSNISNNTISSEKWTNTSYYSFGTGISNPYSGDISNTVSVKDNIFNNVFIQVESVYDAINGGPVVQGNDFNMSWSTNPGGYVGIIRVLNNSGIADEFNISDSEIIIDLQSNNGLSLLGGIFNTWGAEPKNWNFHNLTITYTGDIPPINAFAFTGKNDTSASFDSTNTISNCTIMGAVGTGAIVIKGANKSVVISNSYGAGSTPLTIL